MGFSKSACGELRAIIKALFQDRWLVPQVDFSNLLVEDFLGFLERNRSLVFDHRLERALELKLADDYGFAACPAMLPLALRDLVTELRAFFRAHPEELGPSDACRLGKTHEGLGQAFELRRQGLPLSGGRENSISGITGLPERFLRELFAGSPST